MMVLWRRAGDMRQALKCAAVPAYIVFTDATLVDMCKKHPTTPWDMLSVSGVGRVKLDMYGERFLRVLRAYRHRDDQNT